MSTDRDEAHDSTTRRSGVVDRSIEQRWTKKLAKPFCAISSYFLEHYAELTPHPGAKGLTSTEAMLIVQLMDFKWDERAPYPTVKTLATRLGISTRQTRATVQRLESLGYLRRDPFLNGGPNRYYLDGLFRALENMKDAELDAQAAKVVIGDEAMVTDAVQVELTSSDEPPPDDDDTADEPPPDDEITTLLTTGTTVPPSIARAA